MARNLLREKVYSEGCVRAGQGDEASIEVEVLLFPQIDRFAWQDLGETFDRS